MLDVGWAGYSGLGYGGRHSVLQPIKSLAVPGQDNQLIKTELVSKSAQTKTGIYSPITRNGNLLVNDVLASSFVCLENEKLQKIMYHYMDWAMKLLKMLTPGFFVEMFYSTPANVQ
uniref:Hedgehog protein Hint domain-containing protein n=1 Tax=Romanomermis culicivorax TaxID=13658 RepID=A0A915J6M6_ROMCU